MNEYRVLIVDDDPEQTQLIEDLVRRSRVSVAFEVASCANADDARKLLARGFAPQIAFVDIAFQVDGVPASQNDGIEAARYLLSEYAGVQIIYLADQSEHFTRVYRTDHVYCLLRPVHSEEFEEALLRAVDNLRSRAARPFGVRANGRIMRVLPADIEYIESDRRKVRIFVNGELIEAYESLSGLAAELPDSFIQCHKSFLVNMDKIVEMRSDKVEMASGATIPISQKRSKAARAAFVAYLKERS